MESQDQAKQNQEAKEEQDRQDYRSSLRDFEGGLQDCIKTALEDGIEIDDVLKAFGRGIIYEYNTLLEIKIIGKG